MQKMKMLKYIPDRKVLSAKVQIPMMTSRRQPTRERLDSNLSSNFEGNQDVSGPCYDDDHKKVEWNGMEWKSWTEVEILEAPILGTLGIPR